MQNFVTGVNAIKQNADALNNAMGTLKQQIQANSQNVPQSVDLYTSGSRQTTSI